MAQGIALNKINDPEKVLPKPKWPVRDSGVPSSLAFKTKGFNKAIDQYNQVMIDGDEDKLARLIHEERSLESWDRCSVGDRSEALCEAENIIANLDKWLVLKKG